PPGSRSFASSAAKTATIRGPAAGKAQVAERFWGGAFPCTAVAVLARVSRRESLGQALGRCCQAAGGGHSSFCPAIPVGILASSLSIRPRLWILAVAVFLAFGLQLQAGARAATFITFDVPGSTCLPPFPFCTTPVAINPDGTITGFYADANAALHGFLRT